MTAQRSTRGVRSSHRRSVRLSVALEKRLSAYASAAAAAGVGLVALASSAEAKIVYTPANINIPPRGGRVLLDLNHDGNADFSFSNGWNSLGSHTTLPFLKAGGENQANEVWGRGNFVDTFNQKFVFASALHPGVRVASNNSYFQSGKPWIMLGGRFGRSVSATWGQWFPYTEHRYLGLKFIIDGQIHYGWARLNVNEGKQGILPTITGYAYETIANKPIITGKTKGPDVVVYEPASLGRLAQGASGVSAWRAKPAP